MEKLLYTWIQNQNKALSITNTLQNKRGENSSEEIKSFPASRGWFMCLKTRYSLHSIRVQGEAATVSATCIGAMAFLIIFKEGTKNACCIMTTCINICSRVCWEGVLTFAM